MSFIDETPSFLMLVGLPGSGKSTYIKKYFNQNLRVHSSDAIREELSGDVNNQDINKEVFELLHKRVKEDLRNGISCVYDATNISWKKRKAFLESLKGIKCWKICHVIATPYEVCLEQNRQRDRVVPEDVIKRMYLNFDIPFYNEGWDDIEIWYPKNEYKGAYGSWSRFLLNTFSYEQESKWHTKTLGQHCYKAFTYVEENIDRVPYPVKQEVLVAIALHDCGKPFVKSFKDSKGNPSEYAHYYNHEKVGAYNSLFYSKPAVDNLLIAALIRWHMILHFFKDWEDKTIDKYIREFTSDKISPVYNFYDLLKLINEGDKNAH